MRKWCLMVVAAALMLLGSFNPKPAEAGGDLHRSWSRPVHGWGYYPRPDPYFYDYEPRGYYPYYDSAYWLPPCRVRCRAYPAQPYYYSAWGYARPWRHREWHDVHHGRHRPWHW
jgi:hypothetical protein